MNKTLFTLKIIASLIALLFIAISLLFYKHYKESNQLETLLNSYYLPISSKTNSTLYQLIELNNLWLSSSEDTFNAASTKAKLSRQLSSINDRFLEIATLSENLNNKHNKNFPTKILLDGKKHIRHLGRAIKNQHEHDNHSLIKELSIITHRLTQISRTSKTQIDKLQNNTLENKKINIIYMFVLGISFTFIFFPLIIYLTWSLIQHTRNEQIIRKELDETLLELEKLALYDELTGLANRRLLYEYLKKQLSHSKRECTSICILYIDLDNFKIINDSKGHDAGDAILKHTADSMLSCTRETDIVARLGGDEFVISMSNLTKKNDILKITEHISSRIKESILWENELMSVSSSIGIYFLENPGPDNNETVNSLLSKADKALYAAKSKGRNGYCFYQPT